MARFLYIGVTILHWPEQEVWKMTPYKLLRLFDIHMEMNPMTYGKPKKKKLDAIDEALGGL